MTQGFWIGALIVAGVLLYVVVKVRYYARRSREQWSEVDRSKLRDWVDDDDW